MAAAEPTLEPSLPLTPAPEPGLPWVPLAALGAALAAAGYGASKWFYPKLAVGCEIDVGPDTMGAQSNPLVQKPELDVSISIEAGVPSTPSGTATLVAGDNS